MGKIFIVDDDIYLLKKLELFFQRSGHEVAVTEKPLLALELAEKFEPDIIVLDIVMPEFSGWDVLDGIGRSTRLLAVPVILLSSLGDVRQKVRGLRGGAQDFIAKPFESEELLARVEGMMSRRAQDLDGLQGRLEIHPLSEVLPYLEQNTKSGLLEVRAELENGDVALNRGRLVFASFGKLHGVPAVLALLSLKRGYFYFHPRDRVDGDGGLDEDSQALVLLNAWVEDELAGLKTYRVRPDAPLLLGTHIPHAPASYECIPMVAILRYIQENPGAPFDQLLSAGLHAPRIVSLGVAWLIKENAIVVEDGLT